MYLKNWIGFDASSHVRFRYLCSVVNIRSYLSDINSHEQSVIEEIGKLEFLDSIGNYVTRE